MQILPQSFYLSEDVVDLAKKLLGKVLHSTSGSIRTSGIIVETEAYRGLDDRACHAYNHRYTPKTKTMFSAGGCAYIYICYGIHPLFNVVTGPEGKADVVLIRALEPLEGIETMLERRNVGRAMPTVSNGPGKLTEALGIKKDLDATPLYASDASVFITSVDEELDLGSIYEGPRVGMSKLTGSCAHRPWRFYIKNNDWVSRPREVDYYKKWNEKRPSSS